MSVTQTDELLQAADVSRVSRGEITPSAVRAAALRGELPTAIRSIRGVRMFRRADVDEFLRRRNMPGPEPSR